MRQRRSRKNQEGQAILEYMLLVAFVVGLVAGISLFFRSTIYKFWGVVGSEVSAACPGCPPVDEGVQRLRGN